MAINNAANVLQECDKMLNDFISNMNFIKVNDDGNADLDGTNDGLHIDASSLEPDVSAKDLEAKFIAAAEEQGTGVYTIDPLAHHSSKNLVIRLDTAAGAFRGMRVQQTAEGAAGNTLNIKGAMKKITGRVDGMARGG